MVLKNKFVKLRRITEADVPRFVNWLFDPEVNKFTTRKKVTLKEELDWIKGLSKNKDHIKLAIDTTDGIHIGSIGLEINKEDKKADYDILIGNKQYWGKGYGFYASQLILDHAFKKLKLHRVYLRVYKYNLRAIKLYKKLGFKKEGEGREAIYYKGKFYNQVWMGILRSEWLKNKNNNNL